MLVTDRDGALRATRLLRTGVALTLTERLDLDRGPAYESANLVGEMEQGTYGLAGYGPFTEIDQPIVGTDNFDFMLAGVPNLVANQEPATYGPNYHARSDEFAQRDLRQLRQNAQIAAAVVWDAANAPTRLARAQVADLFRRTDLGQQMVALGGSEHDLNRVLRMPVHRWAASIWVVLLVPVRGADAQHVPAALDSIVLERGRCYGPCPTYRVSVTRSGRVHFASRNPGDTAGTAAARVAPGTVAVLLREAVSAGFFSLPETIASDRTLCPDRATDHATVTTTVFGTGGATRVVDYHGCYARDGDHEPVSIVRRLRGFEDAVDRAAGSARWARPAGPQTPAPPPNEALQLSSMRGRPCAPAIAIVGEL